MVRICNIFCVTVFQEAWYTITKEAGEHKIDFNSKTPLNLSFESASIVSNVIGSPCCWYSKPFLRKIIDWPKATIRWRCCECVRVLVKEVGAKEPREVITVITAWGREEV